MRRTPHRRRIAILALAPDDGAASALRSALTPLSDLRLVSHSTALATESRDPVVRAILLPTRDKSGTSLAPVAEQIRLTRPRILLLLYCRLEADDVRLVADFARAGVDSVVIRGFDDRVNRMREILRAAEQRRATEQSVAALMPYLTATGQEIVRHCLELTWHPRSVDALARRIGVHRRTLVNRCAASRLPMPAALISWCRLIHAAELLSHERMTVENVALELGFGSSAALRNMIRRYLGLSASDLRARGAGAHVVEELRRRVLPVT